jgi:hypothetical protein
VINVKRVDLYSILVKNNFKSPDTDNLMFFRGYAFYFFKNVIQLDDGEIWNKIGSYTDNEWRKLLNRLKNNGHILD